MRCRCAGRKRKGKGEALGANAVGGGAGRHWVGGSSQGVMLLAAPHGEAGSQVGTGSHPAVLRPASPPAGSFSTRAGSDHEALSVALRPLLHPLPVGSMRLMAHLAFHPPVCARCWGWGADKQILTVGQQAVDQSTTVPGYVPRGPCLSHCSHCCISWHITLT